MSPEEVIAQKSPYWEAREKFLELGFGVEALLGLPPAERAKTMCILFEELGWGDSGLAISFGAGMLASLMSHLMGTDFCANVLPIRRSVVGRLPSRITAPTYSTLAG